MSVKFNILNRRLEWYKTRSIFAKWVMQNNSDALVATHIKWKKKTQLELILTHSLWYNASWVVFKRLLKLIYNQSYFLSVHIKLFTAFSPITTLWIYLLVNFLTSFCIITFSLIWSVWHSLFFKTTMSWKLLWTQKSMSLGLETLLTCTYWKRSHYF